MGMSIQCLMFVIFLTCVFLFIYDNYLYHHNTLHPYFIKRNSNNTTTWSLPFISEFMKTRYNASSFNSTHIRQSSKHPPSDGQTTEITVFYYKEVTLATYDSQNNSGMPIKEHQGHPVNLDNSWKKTVGSKDTQSIKGRYPNRRTAPVTLNNKTLHTHSNVNDTNTDSEVQLDTDTPDITFPDKKCFRLSWGKLNLSDLQNCTFITRTAIGRCGNQMFTIAALIGTAYRHDMVPIIKPKTNIAKIFDFPNMLDIVVANTSNSGEGKCCAYQQKRETLDNRKNWTMTGYSQSWRYFDGAERTIRHTFKFNEKYLGEARSFIKNISKAGFQNVCVHARMGDIVSTRLIEKGYSFPNISYIKEAMEFFLVKFNKVQFIVLSNDIKWCKGNIRGDNVIYSPFTEVGSDMALMMSCDHVIMTCGTFGWWGALLAGGTTVYYSGFPRNGSTLARQFNLTDFFPGSWIGMP